MHALQLAGFSMQQQGSCANSKNILPDHAGEKFCWSDSELIPTYRPLPHLRTFDFLLVHHIAVIERSVFQIAVHERRQVFQRSLHACLQHTHV